MINDIRINNLKFSLLNKTKDIINCVVEETDNIIRFNGYTDEIAIKVYKEGDIEATVDTRRKDLFVYENDNLTAIITPRITSVDGTNIGYNASYEDETVLIKLDEEADINATIEFAITANNKVYHIGNINSNEYWFDATAKEIFKINGDERVTVAKHDFITVPYLAPKMLTASKVFYGEMFGGDIYRINADKTLTIESSTEYTYLTALPNNLFIGIKYYDNYRTVTYDLVSYSNSNGFTMYDSYTMTQNGDMSSYDAIPIVTSVDSQGKNINICFVSGQLYGANLDAYYSATIDLGKPTFNFSKSTKGIAILKEAGPGPRVYYDFQSNTLFLGSKNIASSIQPIIAQSEIFTVLAATDYSVQAKRQFLSPRTDDVITSGNYIYNSVSATAYTVTMSNRNLSVYEYIDISIPKTTEHLTKEMVELRGKSFFNINGYGEECLNINNEVIFKGSKGLYKKRIMSWGISSIENTIPDAINLYNISDNTPFYNNFSTTDSIVMNTGNYSPGIELFTTLFVLEKVDSIPVTIKLDTERKVKKTVSKKIEVDTLRKVIMPCETRCRRVFRKIVITGEAKVNNILRKVVRQRIFKLDAKLLFYERLIRKAKTRRKTIVKVEKVINTRRQVVAGREAIWRWIDTKLVITNSMRSRGPLLRKVAINANATIPNILRPVVWIYKDNDGKPIYLDSGRIVHKSINKKIMTLRRIDRIFNYETTIKTYRFIANSFNSNINTIMIKVKHFAPDASLERQLITNISFIISSIRRISINDESSILSKRKVIIEKNIKLKSNREIIGIYFNSLETIRRIIFNNSICTNTITRRRIVINDDNSIFTGRKAVNTIIVKAIVERIIISKYESGYIFSIRKVCNDKVKNIDINKMIVINNESNIDINRKIVDYTWFRNDLARLIVFRKVAAIKVNRLIAKILESNSVTKRLLAKEYIKNNDTKKVIQNKTINKVGTSRKIIKNFNNNIDTFKKVAKESIYLSSTKRINTIGVITDTDTEKNVITSINLYVDVNRMVRNKEASTTLFTNFVLRKGLLYEIDNHYEEVNYEL